MRKDVREIRNSCAAVAYLARLSAPCELTADGLIELRSLEVGLLGFHCVSDGLPPLHSDPVADDDALLNPLLIDDLGILGKAAGESLRQRFTVLKDRDVKAVEAANLVGIGGDLDRGGAEREREEDDELLEASRSRLELSVSTVCVKTVLQAWGERTRSELRRCTNMKSSPAKGRSTLAGVARSGSRVIACDVPQNG